MQTLGSPASLVAAVREDAEAEVERIRDTTAIGIRNIITVTTGITTVTMATAATNVAVTVSSPARSRSSPTTSTTRARSP